MVDPLPVSAIHPQAPEFLSANALFSAAIDLEQALAHMQRLWSFNVNGHWEHVESNAELGTPSGDLFTFKHADVVAMLTPVPGVVVPKKGQLPAHEFSVAMTFYVPMNNDDLHAPMEVRRRHRQVAAHTLMVQVEDVLMREESAVGVYREELGVVHPPLMVTTLADELTKGEAPLPLWVGIRTFQPDLTAGRTLGLNLFGHLDLEVRDSTHPAEEVYELLANVADYIVRSDAFLMPGQTLEYSHFGQLTLAQSVGLGDDAPLIRIGF